MKSFAITLFILTLAFASQAQSVPDSVYISTAKALLLANENLKFEEAMTYFDPSLGNKISAAILKKGWDVVQTKLGPIKNTGIPRVESNGGGKTVYIPCQFENMMLDLKVSLTTDVKALGFLFVGHVDAGAYSLPAYADINKISKMDIDVKTGSFTLPGEFVYPKNSTKKLPVVILVHGSGPNDRDESIDANKPFKDIAYGLASQGIAVIRYDKRTKVYGMQMAEKNNVTLENETIQDAISAIALAKHLDRVDTNRIYVLGHSLGAMAAPRIAAYAKGQIAGIIMMAGPARPLEDLILEQITYLTSLNPSSGAEKQLEETKKEVAKLKDGSLSPKTPSDQLPLGASANYWLYLQHYDQVATVKTLDISILIMQGERDCQVRMTDFDIWKKALKNNPKEISKSYPKLNHLFMEGEGKMSTPAEYEVPSHVAPYVIDDIAGFIGK